MSHSFKTLVNRLMVITFLQCYDCQLPRVYLSISKGLLNQTCESGPQNVSFFSGSLVHVTFSLFSLEMEMSYISLIVAFPALLKVQLKLSFGLVIQHKGRIKRHGIVLLTENSHLQMNTGLAPSWELYRRYKLFLKSQEEITIEGELNVWKMRLCETSTTTPYYSYFFHERNWSIEKKSSTE